jgi:hypothetical protein
MEVLPSLDDADEYCSTHPINSALEEDEINRELRHWHSLCDQRAFEESRRDIRNNPVSKGNVLRVGSLVIAFLGIGVALFFPPAGLPATVVAAGVAIYDWIDYRLEKRRRRNCMGL